MRKSAYLKKKYLFWEMVTVELIPENEDQAVP